MFKVFKKKAVDLTVGETIGLSLGAVLLSFIPFVIAMAMEDGWFERKEKEPPKEIEIDEEEETSD